MLGCITRDEVARVPSPDGAVEAVLVETNGAARTSLGYEVRILETRGYRAALVASLYGAVRKDSAYGLNLRWASNSDLIIEYLEARVVRLGETSRRLAGREIRVTLRDGIIDPDAPAGGMFRNLGRSRAERAR
jgi:hypothetical protein